MWAPLVFFTTLDNPRAKFKGVISVCTALRGGGGGHVWFTFCLAVCQLFSPKLSEIPQVRRLVVSVVLANTSDALLDMRCFRQTLRVVSELWRGFRSHCKVELAVLLDGFLLKTLRAPSPQVSWLFHVRDDGGRDSGINRVGVCAVFEDWRTVFAVFVLAYVIFVCVGALQTLLADAAHLF